LGLIQLALGFIKAGSISNYFPTNVIEGMLAGIGVIIILKQTCIFGYDANFEGDQSFIQSDGSNSFSSLFEVFNHIQLGSVVITVVSLIILIAWDKVPF
jgi:MFS superfamily sulfate permease-like transporter